MNKNIKNEELSRQLLLQLINGKVISANNLADNIGVSEKSIRVKIDNLNGWLKENNLGSIVKKPRIGIWLQQSIEQKMRLKDGLLFEVKQKAPMDQDEARIKKIIEIILRDFHLRKNITTQSIADEIYFSVPTTLKIMKQVKNWFSMFNIRLINKRNFGYVLDGEEISIRMAIKHYLSIYCSNNFESFLAKILIGLDLNKIKKIIFNTERDWNISFTGSSFMDNLIYFSLAIYRNLHKQAKEITIMDPEKKMISNYTEFAFANSLFEKASRNYDLKFRENEIYFLTVQILCSNYIDTKYVFQSLNTTVKMFDDKLVDFVDRVIDVISSVTNIDLSKDKTLRDGLLFHLRSTIFRLKFEKTHDAKLVRQFKEQYGSTFRISWILSALFEKYYDLSVNENELIYIAMYIQAAIERNRPIINLLLVSSLSMSINHLIKNRLLNVFENHINIEVISVHEFRIEDYANIDAILMTSKFEDELAVENRNDSRIFIIEHKLNEEYYISLKNNILNYIFHNSDSNYKLDSICHTLIDIDLMFLNLNCNDKNELIKIMTNKLHEKGFVKPKFHETVLHREKYTSTAIGNRVAIPHGDQNLINEAKVAIATLKSPIKWSDTEVVDVVFLLAVKMDSDLEINRTKKFYEQYVRVLENADYMNFLRNCKSTIELYKFFIK